MQYGEQGHGGKGEKSCAVGNKTGLLYGQEKSGRVVGRHDYLQPRSSKRKVNTLVTEPTSWPPS